MAPDIRCRYLDATVSNRLDELRHQRGSVRKLGGRVVWTSGQPDSRSSQLSTVVSDVTLTVFVRANASWSHSHMLVSLLVLSSATVATQKESSSHSQ